MWRQSKEKRAKPRDYLPVLIGFVCGFLMAFVTLLLYDRYESQEAQSRVLVTATENWQTGYMTALREVATESNSLHHRLTEEVRVLCLVLTRPEYHESRAAHVRATWGKRCSKLIFLSSETNEELDTVRVVEPEADSYSKLWNKTREGFRYAYENHFDDYDWFLKADDDSYVIMENLRYMLYAYSSDMPIYFGYALKQSGTEYMSGGAGYVLSKAALQRFMQIGFHNDILCPAGNSSLAEDFCVGYCMQQVGVIVADSRSVLNDRKSKFFPLDLEAFMNYNETIENANWLKEIVPYQVEWGLNCCSNYSVTFHYVKPSLMYLYEFLIYRLQVAGLLQYDSTVELPKKLTAIEVEEKFNQTNIT